MAKHPRHTDDKMKLEMPFAEALERYADTNPTSSSPDERSEIRGLLEGQIANIASLIRLR
jgi:hypothetical protein